MEPVIQHSWDMNEQDALDLQRELANKVRLVDPPESVWRWIAGVDVGYDKYGDQLFAAVVVLDAETGNVVETATAWDRVCFPYIPGLFSFRELPPVIKAMSGLSRRPDLIICDGQGLAHPRRFGLACHLGVLYELPTIGCGKKRLIGTHQDPAEERGAMAPLEDDGTLIGYVLRTQTGIRPVYVSPGHLISHQTACREVLRMCTHYRLPETTRAADHLGRELLRKHRQ